MFVFCVCMCIYNLEHFLWYSNYYIRVFTIVIILKTYADMIHYYTKSINPQRHGIVVRILGILSGKPEKKKEKKESEQENSENALVFSS